MNAERRKQIQSLIAQVEDLQSEINGILEAEQESFDNMPEGLQSSERGEKAEEAIQQLEEAAGYCDEVINGLHGAVEV